MLRSGRFHFIQGNPSDRSGLEVVAILRRPPFFDRTFCVLALELLGRDWDREDPVLLRPVNSLQLAGGGERYRPCNCFFLLSDGLGF